VALLGTLTPVLLLGFGASALANRLVFAGWALAAAAVLRSLEIDPAPPPAGRRARLALAEALLGGPALRLRGVQAERILEGLVSRYLAS
jgi:hypothetical protein